MSLYTIISKANINIFNRINKIRFEIFWYDFKSYIEVKINFINFLNNSFELIVKRVRKKIRHCNFNSHILIFLIEK